MNVSLVVFTTVALFIVLFPGCIAAGGEQADGATNSESFYTYLLANQFLYELSRQCGTSPSAEIVQGWVRKISDEIGVILRYTGDLHRKLVDRANHLRWKFKTLKGGCPKHRFLANMWTLTLHKEDVLEQQQEQADKDELQRKVDILQQETDELRRKAAALSDKLKKAESVESHRGRSQQKLLEDYSASHQRRLKRKRASDCDDSLAWLQLEGYTPRRLQLVNNRTGEEETVHLAKDLLGPETDGVAENDIDVINMMLLVKDRFSVSGRAYHEFASICKAMPKHYKIKQRIHELNLLWDIYPTPHDTIGVQQSLESRLRTRIQRLLQISSQDASFRSKRSVRVKLSGDGTWIGKRLHVVNFTFTLLDEGSLAHGSEGNHVLAIMKVPETYESLDKALADIRHDVGQLKQIEVDNVTYTVEYYLGGDWKFLAVVTGIDSACSQYACIWCKCCTEERGDIDKKWSISDPTLGARTIEENTTLASRPKSKKKFNVSHKPLFPTIPLVNVVIDNLHLFLRVADVLINHLIEELKREDSIARIKRFKTFEASKHKHIQCYEDFVSSLGIPNYSFYVGKDSQQLKVRTLIGPEKLKLFKNIDIPALLPSSDEHMTQRMQVLWVLFLQLNETLSKSQENLTEEDITAYEHKSKEWGHKYLELYQKKEVTPYIHAMIHHAGEFMHMHGCLLSFTQQGLEKYNDTMTKDYFRSTAHKGTQALIQIMQKQNRMELLSDMEAKRPKHHKVLCSNCKEAGHNKRSCLSSCVHCNSIPFKAHLILVDKSWVPACQKEN